MMKENRCYIGSILGLKGDPEYDEKWERKRQGYRKNGYKIITKDDLMKTKDPKTILTTKKENKGAIDSTEIQLVINEIGKILSQT